MIMNSQTLLLLGSFIQLLMFAIIITGLCFWRKGFIEDSIKKIPFYFYLSGFALTADQIMDFFGYTASEKMKLRDRVQKALDDCLKVHDFKVRDLPFDD